MKLKAIEAVVLAGGRGERVGATKTNKIMMRLAGRPMILYTVDLLKKLNFQKIIIVVGFAKDSVIDYLGKGFVYAEQKKPLGTGDALKVALKKISRKTKNLLVINADDSAFYPPKVLKKLISNHLKSQSQLSFLTVKLKNPAALGRVVRDKKGKLLEVVEAKNATKQQLEIEEINTNCFCFSTSFVKKYLNDIPKDKLSGEYYITSLIGIGLQNKEKVEAIEMEKEEYFQSINTKADLEKADKLMRKKVHEKI